MIGHLWFAIRGVSAFHGNMCYFGDVGIRKNEIAVVTLKIAQGHQQWCELIAYTTSY